jgi:membrane protein insertase Oxa1/YidC/SpoIIIJ
MSSVTSYLPEFAQHFTIWGASGYILTSLHSFHDIPYWACFSITNILVRTSLLPLVYHSAHTAARFAKVAPEVQFLVTIFQQDLKRQKQEGASFGQQWTLIRLTMQTLGGLYQLHRVHPMHIFYSPLAQIPVFWYFSIDLRKIIHGADPALAQDLADSAFLWVPDLTEADPTYGLPVLAGMLLYWNVEMAIGKRSLSGQAASKSQLAYYLKDFFQTIAVFMPCFMSAQPAGMQIYLCTSFLYTLGQGAVLRNNACRSRLGLPKLGGPPVEGDLAKEFMQLKQLERKAQELRGNGPLLGRGVLAAGLECSFAGTNRPSTIIGSNPEGGPDPVLLEMMEEHTARMTKNVHARVEQEDFDNGPFIPGISALPEEMMERRRAALREQEQPKEEEYVPEISDDVMEAANRGERPVTIAPVMEDRKTSKTLTAKRFIKSKQIQKRSGGKNKNRKR